MRPLRGLFRGDVQRRHGGERPDLLLGTSEQDVEAAAARGAGDRTEILADLRAFGRRSIDHRNDDDVALVALHVFQVLYEELLKAIALVQPSVHILSGHPVAGDLVLEAFVNIVRLGLFTARSQATVDLRASKTPRLLQPRRGPR